MSFLQKRNDVLTTVNTKKRYHEFLFICLLTKLQRQKWIFVLRNSAVKPQHVLFENEPFLHKMLVSFFSSNIPLYIGKNPVEKLCKVLEMELKTYTPVGLKFVSEKIKFKVLHYIQHDFIRQRPGLSKDQISMFKSLVINYFILMAIITVYDSTCGKCSPETKLLTK